MASDEKYLSENNFAISHESVDATNINLSSSIVRNGKKPCELVPSKPTKERVYDTSHNSIGEAIVFNQVHFDDERLSTRHGSNQDVSSLNKVLKGLGFKFTSYDNLTVNGIKDKLKAAAVKNYSNSSCLMIFVLTHGDSNGKLRAKDGEFEVEDLYNSFIKNSSLHGKPKLFFLQACRGSFTDVGVIAKKTSENQLLDSTDSKVLYDGCYTIPNYADMVIMYATVEGVVSFRDNVHGSWLIQNLCDEIHENPHEDLLSILTNVNSRVAHEKQSFNPKTPEYDSCKQMPVVKHTLTKKFFFTKTASNGEIASGTLLKTDKK